MTREEARIKAEELVSKMTISQMASQLKFDSPAIEELGVQEYNWWNECLHGVARAGVATSFPQAIGIGAAFDKELMTEMGNVISDEARAKYNEFQEQGDYDIYKGLTYWSPNVNVFRDPRWGRGQETYGEDPYLISSLAVPFIKALQGDGEYMKIAACAKHFAVHSGPEAQRHYFDAICTLKDMWETYLPAFEACVTEAQVESVMGAYNRTNGEPCCAHSYLMDEVLRGKWGFEGHYVSDCWAVRDFHENHKVTSRPEESVTLALGKGCDLNCGCTYQRIMNAYEEGLLPEEFIRRSAVRLFTTRYLLGMGSETKFDKLNYLDVETEHNLEVAERASLESQVLLKNDGILPFDKNKEQTIAIIGPNADSRDALIGNYYGTSSEYITLNDGIRKVAGEKTRILYSEGCHLYKDQPDPLSRPMNTLSEAKAVMKRADVVVLCLGLDATLEGEEGDTSNAYASGDKNDLSFPAPQLELINAVKESGKPFVVVVMTGSAMDLTPFNDEASAILQAWYPGARGGLATAKILFGEVSPSGKLPVTFYTNENHLPDFTDYSMKNRTYRYLEEKPLYPFGFGLTYSNVKVANIDLAEGGYKNLHSEGLDFNVSVLNSGNVDTSDVVEIYVHYSNDPMEVLNPRLVSFERVFLKAGELKEVKIHIDSKAFMVVEEDGSRRAGTGDLVLYAGTSQPDDRSVELTGNWPLHVKITE